MSGVSAAGSATVEAGKPLKITSFNELIESLIKGGNLSEGDAEASLDFLLDDASETLISVFPRVAESQGRDL